MKNYKKSAVNKNKRAEKQGVSIAGFVSFVLLCAFLSAALAELPPSGALLRLGNELVRSVRAPSLFNGEFDKILESDASPDAESTPDARPAADEAIYDEIMAPVNALCAFINGDIDAVEAAVHPKCILQLITAVANGSPFFEDKTLMLKLLQAELRSRCGIDAAEDELTAELIEKRPADLEQLESIKNHAKLLGIDEAITDVTELKIKFIIKKGVKMKSIQKTLTLIRCGGTDYILPEF